MYVPIFLPFAWPAFVALCVLDQMSGGQVLKTDKPKERDKKRADDEKA